MKTTILVASLIAILFAADAGIAIADSAYPKALSATNARQYFSQHPKIKMKKPRNGFDLVIRGNVAERECADCHWVNAYADLTYRNNKVCFDWEVSFPPSGCFNFVQVSPGGFELQNDDGEMVYAWGSKKEQVVIKAGPAYVERFANAILVEVDKKNLDKARLQKAIVSALNAKGWVIIKNESNKIVAGLEKGGTTYRVMVKTKDNWVAIGFIDGYGASSDGWLYNIKKKLEVALGQ